MDKAETPRAPTLTRSCRPATSIALGIGDSAGEFSSITRHRRMFVGSPLVPLSFAALNFPPEVSLSALFSVPQLAGGHFVCRPAPYGGRGGRLRSSASFVDEGENEHQPHSQVADALDDL